MDRIPEKDWKKLRSMQKELLDKACGVALSSIRSLIDEREGGNHKTFSNLWNVIKKEDKKIGLMFDDMKRSEAMLKIAFMFKSKIIDENILKEFCAETQKHVKNLLKISYRDRGKPHDSPPPS